MEKINVAELLRNCPKGMELDCTMYDNVVLEFVANVKEDTYPIKLKTKTITLISLTEYGCYDICADAKCIIFPKGKSTWEGFVPPYEFKDGDIIFTHTDIYDFVSIFKQFIGRSCCTYIDICIKDNELITDTKGLCNIEDIIIQRLANEEEKQKLFDAIKNNGYRWNPETNTLEKLIEPKFNVGDKIRHKTHIRQGNVVTEIKDTHYILDDELALPFISQDDYELVPDKFNINTLVPFESKVLVRNDEGQYWIPAFWGCKRADGYTTTFGWCKYCIPYEGNEHLLGTTNDCNEYFKNWK